MKLVSVIIAGLMLLGVGCDQMKSSQKTDINVTQVQIFGNITQIIDDNSFVILKKSSETGEDTTEKITVSYNEKTRFAVPDGSGIGAPIARPQIEAGMQVDVHGELQSGLEPHTVLFADNIIFSAE